MEEAPVPFREVAAPVAILVLYVAAATPSSYYGTRPPARGLPILGNAHTSGGEPVTPSSNVGATPPPGIVVKTSAPLVPAVDWEARLSVFKKEAEGARESGTALVCLTVGYAVTGLAKKSARTQDRIWRDWAYHR
jgi:hypothetical protein